MSIEQVIAENTAAMRELITVLKSQANQSVESDDVETIMPSVPEEVKTDPPVEVPTIPTQEEMKIFMHQIIDKKGTAFVIDVFKEFGLNRLSDFDSSQYIELKQRLEA